MLADGLSEDHKGFIYHILTLCMNFNLEGT